MGIRKANADTDLPALIEIEQACFKSGFSGSTFFYFIKSESSPLYIYEEESGIQGYCLCTKNTVLDELWIASLAVRPESRRKGLGTQLLKHVIQRNASSPVWLTCKVKAPSLISFYEGLGFTQSKTVKDPYEDGSDRVLFTYSNQESL